MARMARVVVPGLPHHVTQRGNRRQTTFFEPADYVAYLSWLAAACKQYGTSVWAYCLMPNHVHFVMVPSTSDGLRATLSNVHRRYEENVNHRFGWRGHLWQERFYSCPLDEGHLHAAVRYVERNPISAGLVGTATEWPWSSARAHLAGQDDRLVKVAAMLQRVDDWTTYLATALSDTQLDAISRHTRTGRPLGCKAFVNDLERQLRRDLAPKSRGRKSIG